MYNEDFRSMSFCAGDKKNLLNTHHEFSAKDEAAAFLLYWCDLEEESEILPMMEYAASIK